jgi:hypothetical protein
LNWVSKMTSNEACRLAISEIKAELKDKK